MQRKDFILTSDLLSTTVKIDICLQMGRYILLNLISCRFPNFRQIKCISLTKCEVQWCQPCRSFLEGISVLILLWAKLPHVYIYIYIYTMLHQDSWVLCVWEADSSLQTYLWKAGGLWLAALNSWQCTATAGCVLLPKLIFPQHPPLHGKATETVL